MYGPCDPVPPPGEYFAQEFMRRQYEYGCDVAGAGNSPWRDSLDSLPNADTVYGSHPCRKQSLQVPGYSLKTCRTIRRPVRMQTVI
jgi:hypothetical protein